MHLKTKEMGCPDPLIVHMDRRDSSKQNTLFAEIADYIEANGVEGWDKLDLDSLIDDRVTSKHMTFWMYGLIQASRILVC